MDWRHAWPRQISFFQNPHTALHYPVCPSAMHMQFIRPDGLSIALASPQHQGFKSSPLGFQGSKDERRGIRVDDGRPSAHTWTNGQQDKSENVIRKKGKVR